MSMNDVGRVAFSNALVRRSIRFNILNRPLAKDLGVGFVLMIDVNSINRSPAFWAFAFFFVLVGTVFFVSPSALACPQDGLSLGSLRFQPVGYVRTGGWKPVRLQAHGSLDGSGPNLQADHPVSRCLDRISSLCGKDFQIYGYVDQGFTWNPASPADRTNGLVMNNYRSNDYQMNAVYFVAEKKISDQTWKFQLGGRVDLVYGTDARFMSVDGLGDNIVSNGASRYYKMAFRQAYLNLFLPIGRGASVKVGTYVSPIGQETGYAPANFFYSHLLCDSLQPGSPTGLLFEYPLTDNWTVRFGPNFGWGTFNNINHSVSYAGSVAWTSNDKKTQIQFDYQDGIQRTQVVDDTSMVMYYSLILNHQVTNRLDYIMEHDLMTSSSRLVPSNSNDDYQCYAIANYLVYEINERWKSGLRVEWLQNNGGRLSGVNSSDLAASGDYYDITLGLNWQASPHVRFRPEMRYDWQTPYQPQDQPLSYDDNTSAKNWLFSCDVLWEF